MLGLRAEPPWHSAPATYSNGDESVALLAYSWRPRQYDVGLPKYAEVHEAAVLADVARARATHTSVIVSLHWGAEFVMQPSTAEVAFAHKLVETGVDLVLGHHPHVVRPLELHGCSAIAYSLGNCMTDMVWLDVLREGALVEAKLSPRPSDVRLTRTRVDESYHVRLVGFLLNEDHVRLAALDEPAYEAAGKAGERLHRMASYKHLLGNILRYEPRVLGELIGNTRSNKWRAAVRRIRGTSA